MELLKKLLADRMAKTLFLAVVLMLVMGSLRPEKPKGLYPGLYWAEKAAWEYCCDMVLAGDSRVLMGLSPAEMRKHLGDINICNFGFGGTWYSEEYIAMIEKLLDPQSSRKSIVLGISPHSLTRRDDKSGNFFETAALSKRDIFIERCFAPVIFFFEPMSLKDAMEGLFPSLAESQTNRHYYPDGWISMNKFPTRIDRELKKYRGYYEQRKVDQNSIENILKAVSEWTNDNIRVYGYVPPSCIEMYEMEAQISGFDEENFTARFEKAGGIWVDVDHEGHDSFDGSHLQDTAALKFSEYFAKYILSVEKNNRN